MTTSPSFQSSSFQNRKYRHICVSILLGPIIITNCTAYNSSSPCHSIPSFANILARVRPYIRYLYPAHTPTYSPCICSTTAVRNVYAAASCLFTEGYPCVPRLFHSCSSWSQLDNVFRCRALRVDGGSARYARLRNIDWNKRHT